MNPAIRIASFILLVIGLTTTNHTMLWAIFPVLYLLYKHTTVSSVWPLLTRLRWLFLSLFILHLWFNQAEITGIPSLPGFIFALERTLALIIIVLTAHLLVTTTPIQDIIAALHWWFAPLQRVGLSVERLIVRLALVLDTVNQVQDLYGQPTQNSPLKTNAPMNFIDRHLRAPLNHLSEKVADLFTQVLTRAEITPLKTLEIPPLCSPPWWQWSYPVLIGILILGG